MTILVLAHLFVNIDLSPVQLAAFLKNWDRQTSTIKSVSCDFVTTNHDQVLRRKEEIHGHVIAMKSGYLWLESYPNNANKTSTWERFVSNGERVTLASSRDTETQEFLSADLDLVKQNIAFELFTGSISAARAQERFDLKVLRQTTENYIQLELSPRQKKDQLQWSRIVVAIVRDSIDPQFRHLNGLPAKIHIVGLLGHEVNEWDFTRNLKVNLPDVNVEYFQQRMPKSKSMPFHFSVPAVRGR